MFVRRNSIRNRPNQIWGKARMARTKNMLFMSPTLEVLKLSCWLNAVAACRVQVGTYAGVGDVGVWAMRECGQTQLYIGQGMRAAHREHLAHAYDSGRVETQRLVESCRGLPCRKWYAECGWEIRNYGQARRRK